MFKFGQPPSFTYSDMNGYGPFVPNLVLSAVYWSGIALVFIVLAYLFWVRGTGQRFAARLQMARTRWQPPAIGMTLLGFGIAGAAGGTIFYNTNIRNAYEPPKVVRQLQASYGLHRFILTHACIKLSAPARRKV